MPRGYKIRIRDSGSRRFALNKAKQLRKKGFRARALKNNKGKYDVWVAPSRKR